ncbi:glucosaminyl deacetylase [Arthrobacter phage Gorpy]|nr:glucosaminyl deacetylase [Arthrobacter phage Gorpy]
MAKEIVGGEPPVSPTDSGVKRRGLLRLGTLLTALTGASTLSSMSAEAAVGDPISDYPPVNQATPARPWPETRIISAVQAGHGFVSGGLGSFNLNDTTEYVSGSQSISITTNGAGGQAWIKKSGLALNMTGKGVLLWVKVTAPAMNKLGYLFVDLGDAALTNYYRGFVWNFAGPLKAGEWVPVQIPWSYFAGNVGGSPTRANIDTIRIVAGDVSGGQVTVAIGAVATFAEGTTKYPKGVVSFTFDDSFQSAYTVGLAKLAQHGHRATLFPILSRLDTGSYLTMAQVKMMQAVHGWEIGTHATSDATHVDYNTLTSAQIDAELKALRAWQSLNGITSSSFAYPAGGFSSAIAAHVLPYYASARANFNMPSTPVTNQPHRLPGMVLGASTTLAAAKTRVDTIAAGGGWQPFVIHDLIKPTRTTNDWLPADFIALVDHCITKGVAVVPIGEVISATH